MCPVNGVLIFLVTNKMWQVDEDAKTKDALLRAGRVDMQVQLGF